MRFSTSALVALPAVLLASSSAFTSVSANECTCPSWTDNGGNNGNGGGGSPPNNGGNNGGNNGNNDWWAPAVKPIKYVPKVEATKENLQNGAADAIKQLTDKKLVPDGEFRFLDRK